MSTPESQIPDGLADRGSALWVSLGQATGTAAGEIALEACRIADRLDDIDRVIAGKGVLNLLQFRLDLDLEMGDARQVNVEVKFGSVLAEARQQAAAMKGLLVELGVKPAAAGGPPAEEEASPLAKILALVQPGANTAGGRA